MEENKLKALQAAMANIEKKFGKGSIQRLGDTNILDVEAISTGSIKLDKALGIGGLPEGRIIEIYGPESSGKTTLTLHAIAEAQKKGKICAFVDAEHALDPVYAKKLGVDIQQLLVSQPDNGEQALEIVDELTRSGVVNLIVIDSVAALTPKAEIEGDMGDSHMGLQARLMSQGLRKITGVAKQNNVTIIFINQLRMKIGVMFGSPETTTGGNALKFYASVRLDIRRTGSIKNGDEVVANEVKIKVVKNKVAPPFKEVITSIEFGKGFNPYREVLDLAVDYDFIKKAGAWYSDNITSDKIGQGAEKAIDYLKTNKEYYEKLVEKVRAKLKEDNSVSLGASEDIEEEFNEDEE